MIKHLQKLSALALVAGFVLGSNTADAQVTLTDLAYSQNFDGMGPTGTTFPEGWSAVRYATTSSSTPPPEIGPIDLVVFATNSNSGAIYNVGAVGESERAFGSISSGSTYVRFGAGFVNGTTNTIGTVRFAAVMEQWRSGSSATVNEVSAFEYSLNASGINDATATWTPLTSMDLNEILTATTTAAAVDGNATENKATLTGEIANITLAPGESIYIRWSDPDNTGSDGLYAIDDFTMTWTAATTTGIADATKGMFSIYPNPMQNQNVRLALPGHVSDQKVNLTVWSVEGKVLLQSNGSLSSVQAALNEKVSTLSKGMFFVNVAAGKEIYQTKLMKN